MKARNKLGQFKFKFHVPFDRDAVSVAAVASIKIDLSAIQSFDPSVSLQTTNEFMEPVTNYRWRRNYANCLTTGNGGQLFHHCEVVVDHFPRS